MSSPKISIIIPVYNGEKYLGEFLNSLIKQTFKDIEIICINDGSTDKSAQILQNYACKDARIKIISRQNCGAAYSRNTGILNAAGDFLSFLDCDDFFDLNMFEELYGRASKCNADITVCRTRFFDNETKLFKNSDCTKIELLPDKICFSAEEISNSIFQFDIMWCWNKLFKKSFIINNKLFFQDIKTHNDVFFSAYSLSICKKISAVNKILCSYRINRPDSITSKKLKYPENFYKALTLLKENMTQAGVFKTFEQSFVNFAMDLFYGYYKVLDIEFKRNFLKNLNIDNLNVKFDKNIYFILYAVLSHKTLITAANILFPFVRAVKHFLAWFTKY